MTSPALPRLRGVRPGVHALLALALLGLPVPRDAGARQATAVAREPSLSVGSLDDEDTSFQDIRALLPTPDGGLVVADGGSGTVRVFGPDGRPVRRFGGRGDGPGELRQLAGLFRGPGDSLLAFDFAGSNVSVFDARGGFGRSFRLLAPGSAPGRTELSGVLPGGELLVAVYLDGGDGRDDGHQLWRYAADGAPVERRATLPGRLVGSSGGGEMRIDIVVPWGAMPMSAAAGRAVIAGHGSAYPVRFLTDEGPVREGSPPAFRPRAVTDDVVDGFIDRMVARAPEAVRARVRPAFAALRDAPRPEHLPFFDAILPAPDGGAWVRRFDAPGDAERRWDVFGPDGTYRETVVTSSDLDIRYVEERSVLAVWRDDLDVEHARRYPLEGGR